jgi:hypothetical protein
MNLLNFSTTFPDEASCKVQWKAMRDKQGVKCPHCGSRSPYWKSDKDLLTSTKKSFSAKELQRQLGHKYYELVWALLHKLHTVMGRRNSEYPLGGVIELDEGFYSTEVRELQIQSQILWPMAV